MLFSWTSRSLKPPKPIKFQTFAAFPSLALHLSGTSVRVLGVGVAEVQAQRLQNSLFLDSECFR